MKRLRSGIEGSHAHPRSNLESPAQTEITETGMNSDARTTSTHATIRLVRGVAELEGPGQRICHAGRGSGAELEPAPDEIAPILPCHRG